MADRATSETVIHKHLVFRAGRVEPAGSSEDVPLGHAVKLRAFGAVETDEPPAPRIQPRPDPNGSEALKARLREELKEELLAELRAELAGELSSGAAKSSRRKAS